MALTWTWLLTYCDIFIRQRSRHLLSYVSRFDWIGAVLYCALCSQLLGKWFNFHNIINERCHVWCTMNTEHMFCCFPFEIFRLCFYDLVSHCSFVTEMNSKFNRLHIEYWMIVEAHGTVTSNEYITYFK